MSYRNLQECVADLEAHGHLVRIDAEVDPHLELAAIQRRAFRAKAPALLFTRVKGTPFPMLSNLFGTRERLHFIFRRSLPAVEAVLTAKADPAAAMKRPLQSLKAVPGLLNMLPSVSRVRAEQAAAVAPVLECQGKLADLPQLVCWPMDGGPFITLPLVYSEDPAKPGADASNLGMYRVQLGGNEYAADEVGLHYQIHRGIGAHHARALEMGKPLPVHIYVGGPPSLTVAAVMPLPEGLSELRFAGLLGGRRTEMAAVPGLPLPVLAQADFCISGHVLPQCKPEGPFGDHVGYYSLAHDFPVLKVDAVHHRKGAIWPFTAVGRPPQEDTVFGDFIHELTGPLVPQVFQGVCDVHAVDAAGVHPLLLAVGSERYTPYEEERRPRELITAGLHLLGTTQTALASMFFLWRMKTRRALQPAMCPPFCGICWSGLIFRAICTSSPAAPMIRWTTRAARLTKAPSLCGPPLAKSGASLGANFPASPLICRLCRMALARCACAAPALLPLAGRGMPLTAASPTRRWKRLRRLWPSGRAARPSRLR